MTAIKLRVGTLCTIVSLAAMGAAAPAIAREPAACTSKPRPAAQPVGTPSAATQGTSQVVDEIRKVVPDAVAPQQGAPSPGVDPALEADGSSLRARGSLTAFRVARDPAQGFSIGSGDGAVCATPARIGDKATDGELIGEDAVVFANTDRATSTVLRPTAAGTESFTVMNDTSAPTQFSWRLTLGKGQVLSTLADGRVAVINPRPAAVPGVKLTFIDAGNDAVQPGSQAPAEDDAAGQARAVGDTGAQLAESADVFDEAERQTAGEVVLVFPKPWALDADGRDVPATLTASGDTVTMSVDRSATSAFPVVASPAPTASAALVGGPLRAMTFNMRGTEPVFVPPGETPRRASRAEFERHDARIANTIFNQLGSTDARGDVPGVAGLQEVCYNDYLEILRRLNARDNTNDWFGYFADTQPSRLCLGPRAGTAIFRNVARFRTSDFKILYGDQELGGQLRGFQRQQLNVRGRGVFVFNTHLEPGAVSRDQAAQLYRAAQAVPDRARMVMGDFNIRRDRPEISRLNPFYRAPYREVDSDLDEDHPGAPEDQGNPTFTNPNDGNRSKIDYIFIARLGLNGTRVRPVDKEDTSDHDPLITSTNVPE